MKDLDLWSSKLSIYQKTPSQEEEELKNQMKDNQNEEQDQESSIISLGSTKVVA